MTTSTAPRPELPLSWKELYDRYESFWAAPTQQWLGSETFSQLMSATRENFLTQQKTSREALDQHWETMRLPSKRDHARLAGLVVNAEAKIDTLNERIESLESKLDAVLDRLDALMAAETSEASEKEAKRRAK